MNKAQKILSNLRIKEVSELKLELEDVIKKLARLKLERGTSRLKKISDLIKEKIKLSQILTVISEKEKNV